MVKVSFILPCYNVERYIADCLDSIYAQDMSEDEYEVICVNDCSTDGTRDIIREFASKHPNLTLIDHERNMTVGGARNTGLSAAKGEYVWFVDPDDMVKLGAAKDVYAKASEKKLDLLMFNYNAIDEQLRLLKEDSTFMDSDVKSGQEYVLEYFPDRFSEFCIVWRNVFRKAFLLKNELWFPKMPKGEDVSFLWEVMILAEKVASIKDVCYIYRRNPYSVVNKRLDPYILFSERILFANEIKRIFDDNGYRIIVLLQKEMERTLRWCVNSNLDLLRQMTLNEKIGYYNEIVNNKDVLNSVRPYMNRKHRRLFSTKGGTRFWLFKVRVLEIM